MRRRLGLLLAALLCGGAGPDMGMPAASPAEVAAFLPRLNRAAARADRAALCDMLSFPVRVLPPNRQRGVIVRDPRACARWFPLLFPPPMLHSMATLTPGALRRIGPMFGPEDGRYWIGKYYRGPRGEAPAHVDFDDARHWPVGLVGLAPQ